MTMLLWNLFLALAPVPLARAIERRAADAGSVRRFGPVGFALAVAWLGLLPNAPYLLTEIRHYVLDAPFREVTARASHDVPSLRLAAVLGGLFLAYGFVGLLAYVAAVRPVERAIRVRDGRRLAFRVALALVVALGVWMGLVARLNSWDVVFAPWRVIAALRFAVTHPATLAGIAVFGSVLLGAHVAVDLAVCAWRARSRGVEERGAPERVDAAKR